MGRQRATGGQGLYCWRLEKQLETRAAGRNSEANLQAKHAPQEKNSWLQGADADASRQGNYCAPAPKGPGQANPLVPLARGSSSERTLGSAAEFQRVLRAGRAVSTPCLRVHALRREDDGPGRHGFVVSRRHGGAVDRNRVKRQARAALRLAGGIPPGFDSVIAVRPGRRVEVASLTEEIRQALEEIRSNCDEVGGA
jgi:ribonuclease P protein component